MVVRPKPPEAGGRTRRVSTELGSTVCKASKKVGAGYVTTNSFLALLPKKKLCQLGYTYKMSDDGYGGGGGDDYDYGGPRSVPLSYPLREHC